MAKIRLSFVTNSSSSSYIVAYKSCPEIDEETLTKYPFLKYYVKLVEKILLDEGGYETDRGYVYETKEEWDEGFVYRYGWKDQDTVEKILEDDERLQYIYNEALDYIKKGFNILYKSIGYSDDLCIEVFNELSKDKDNFIILEGE